MVISALRAGINLYATPNESKWLESVSQTTLHSLQRAFVATPRFIAKTPIKEDVIVNDVNIKDWTLDRLVRVYLLTQLNADDKAAYTKAIDTLFDTAENNEAVALISALPFLSYPDYWLLRATDAVRSNIGVLFDAIAFGNPYPQLHFSELAWNQLVLKCIFNDKPIHKIIGLEARANATLAQSISDLAHERWAAGRAIPPQAWRLVSKFMTPVIFEDIAKLFESSVANDRVAAALLCQSSNDPALHTQLQKYPTLHAQIEANDLHWEMLEDNQTYY